MDLLFYAGVSAEKRESLIKLITKVVPQGRMEICPTLTYLSQRLKQPLMEKTVAILAPASREELLEVVGIQDLLRNLRLIVIVPDHEVETTAMAFRLRPRFLTYASEDWKDLRAVLQKMTGGQDHDRESQPANHNG